MAKQRLEDQIGSLGGEETIETEFNPSPRKFTPSSDKSDGVSDRDISLGWIPVNRNNLENRGIYYPESWNFKIKAASVKEIKNWSSINDEDPNSTIEAFNEILKNCLSISDGFRNYKWNKICDWDKFYFALLIRELTFVKGESAYNLTKKCNECDNGVNVPLSSDSMIFKCPDNETVLKHYHEQERLWLVDPTEYNVKGPKVVFYIPTLEKSNALKNWAIDKTRAEEKLNESFLKFLPWLVPNIIPTERKELEKMILEAESTYQSWEEDMFMLMDEVIDNVLVSPERYIVTQCNACGEEVRVPIRFPDGIRSLFIVSSGRPKFSQKS